MDIQITEQYPGIYYVKGAILFQVQIIVTKNLDRKKHAGLKIVTSNADEQDVRQFLTDMIGIDEQGDLNNIDAILQVSVSANSEIYEKIGRDATMCQALRELMKDEIDKEIEETRNDTTINTTIHDLKNIMESFKVTAVQAMDSLKIPASERAFYQSKL